MARFRTLASITTAATFGVACLIGTPAASQPAPTGPVAQTEPEQVDPEPVVDAGMSLIDETYTVEPGGTVRLSFLVTGDVPEITTTTTTTTTTSTTTTTTTTTTPPTTVPTTVPGQVVAPLPPTTVPSATTTTAPPTTTTTTTLPPGPEMVVQVRAHATVESRAEVDAADADDPGPIIDIVQFDLDDVGRVDEATGDRIVDLAIELTESGTDFDRLDLTEAGVYPVTVQIRRAGRVAAHHTTFIEVLDTSRFGRGPLTYAVFAAVDDFGPTPTPRQLDVARTAIEHAIDVALTVDGPVTLSLPPSVIAEFEVVDTALIDDLQAAVGPGDLLLAGPDVELDPSSAAAAGLIGGFTDRVVAGEEYLTTMFPGVPIARAAWPVTTDITPEGAAVLRDLGMPLLVVPPDRYVTFDGNIGPFVDTTLLSGAELPDRSLMRMIIVDEIDQKLEVGLDDGFNATERAVRVMAGTGAVRYGLSPDLRGMVLTAPDLTAPDAATMGEVERFVQAHPQLDFGAISRLSQINTFFVDQEPHTVELSTSPSVAIGARVERADAIRLLVSDTASVLPADDERPTVWERRLRLAMSTGLTSVEAGAIFTDIDAEIDAVRSAVLQPESYQFTVAGHRADVPIRIENTGSTPITVVVSLRADKLSVPGGDVTEVLAPNAVTDVVVPVETRSNGIFPVMVEVRTPVGNLLTEPVEMTARVTSLSGIGRVVTVGALLVLLSWWYSYFRRRRTQRIEQSSTRHPSNDTVADTDITGDPTPAWPGRLGTNGDLHPEATPAPEAAHAEPE